MPAPVLEAPRRTAVEKVSVQLAPAQSAVHSLVLLAKVDALSGLGEWVTSTAARMTAEERRRNEVVVIGLHYAVVPERDWPSFPAYIEHLAAANPEHLRDKVLKEYASLALDGPRALDTNELSLDVEGVLKSEDGFLDYLKERFDPEHIHEEVEREAYRYLVDPPAMRSLIVSHLRQMWEGYLEPEWKRVERRLLRAKEAAAGVDLTAVDGLEAARRITGNDLEGEKWEKRFEEAEHIVLVPNAHIGPYAGSICIGPTSWVFFSPRAPEGVGNVAPELGHADIVVRLDALANDIRMSILKMISEEGEMRSQEVLERLELSQSAASRHLKQLSATGFLAERRCEGAKCYRINMDRIQATLDSVAAYLTGE